MIIQNDQEKNNNIQYLSLGYEEFEIREINEFLNEKKKSLKEFDFNLCNHEWKLIMTPCNDYINIYLQNIDIKNENDHVLTKFVVAFRDWEDPKKNKLFDVSSLYCFGNTNIVKDNNLIGYKKTIFKNDYTEFLQSINASNKFICGIYLCTYLTKNYLDRYVSSIKSYTLNDNISKIKNENFYEYAIEHWNINESCYKSPFFTIGGYEWQMEVIRENTFINLKLILNSNLFKEEEYFDSRLVFYVRNGYNLHCFEAKQWNKLECFSKQNNMIKFDKFIKESDLYAKKENSNESIIDNNIIIFGVYIRIHRNYDSIDLPDPNENDKIPLINACIMGDKKKVKNLIYNGANVNIKDEDNEFPLLYACIGNNYSIVKLLIDNGAHINEKNKDNETPLFIACDKTSINMNIVKYLIVNGAKIYKDMECRTPLSIIRLRDMDNNSEEEKYLEYVNNVPFIMAYLNNNINLIDEFINNGVYINMKNKYGDTLFMIACYLNNNEIIKHLIGKEGINLFNKNKDGDSALTIMCYLNNDIILEDLMDNGIKQVNPDEPDEWKEIINTKNNYGDNPLIISCYHNNDKIVKILVDNKAEINIKNKRGDNLTNIINNLNKKNKQEENASNSILKYLNGIINSDTESSDDDFSSSDDFENLDYQEEMYCQNKIMNFDSYFEKLKRSVCLIEKKDNGNRGTGFLVEMSIPFKKKSVFGLMTNNHVLDEEIYQPNFSFKLRMGHWNDDKWYDYKIDEKRYVFTSNLIDITLIQLNKGFIKENIDDLNFLCPDDDEDDNSNTN
eukprot:jgi/Orpsp1_1/1184356/evm.model.c7180000089213.1